MEPYFFRRTPADVLEEALDELVRQRLREVAGRQVQASAPKDAAASADIEREVVREQRRTLFEYDAGMRELFANDFEAFSAAMDDPELLERRMGERIRAHEEPKGEEVQRWDATRAPARAWEEARHHDAHAGAHGDDDAETLDDDQLYDAAFRWACHVERWARERAAEASDRDRDLTRISVNALLVPAKIAFAFPGSLSADPIALEVAAVGYRQATIFCSRVLDSLASCYGRSVGDREDVHEYLDEGKEIHSDIQSRLAEVEQDLRWVGRNGKTP